MVERLPRNPIRIRVSPRYAVGTNLDDGERHNSWLYGFRDWATSIGAHTALNAAVASGSRLVLRPLSLDAFTSKTAHGRRHGTTESVAGTPRGRRLRASRNDLSSEPSTDSSSYLSCCRNPCEWGSDFLRICGPSVVRDDHRQSRVGRFPGGKLRR